MQDIITVTQQFFPLIVHNTKTIHDFGLKSLTKKINVINLHARGFSLPEVGTGEARDGVGDSPAVQTKHLHTHFYECILYQLPERPDSEV